MIARPYPGVLLVQLRAEIVARAADRLAWASKREHDEAPAAHAHAVDDWEACNRLPCRYDRGIVGQLRAALPRSEPSCPWCQHPDTAHNADGCQQLVNDPATTFDALCSCLIGLLAINDVRQLVAKLNGEAS